MKNDGIDQPTRLDLWVRTREAKNGGTLDNDTTEILVSLHNFNLRMIPLQISYCEF